MLSSEQKWDKFIVPVYDFLYRYAHDSLKQKKIQRQSILTFGVRTPIGVIKKAFQFIFLEMIYKGML